MTNIETKTKTNHYYFKVLAWLAARLSAMMTLAKPAKAGFGEASSKIVSPEVVGPGPQSHADKKEIDMKPPASKYVTLVEVMELTRPFEEFAQAVRAAARRLEAEGIQKLVLLQFYGNPRSTQVGALLTFSD